jgi:hypothetical protein
MEGVRVRGRGALMTACRTIGAVLGFAPVLGYLAGDVATATVLVTSCVAVAWQIWLFRPGVRITGSAVVLQGLVRDRSLPMSGVDSFTVATQRQPGDLLDRSVHLVIETDDGRAVLSRWVAWQDMISPWIANGERPLPARTQHVVDGLNTELAARQAVDAAADGAMDEGGICP